MKEEQKGKTLGQFREQVSSLEAEVTSLKRQLAGSKGRNKKLAEENKELKDKISLLEGDNSKEVEQLRDALATANESITNYKSELRETKIKLTDYKAIVEWYNELPWWRKVFLFRLL